MGLFEGHEEVARLMTASVAEASAGSKSSPDIRIDSAGTHQTIFYIQQRDWFNPC